MKKLLDVCSLFMAIIGSCAAILVCFILFVYPNQNNDSSGRKDNMISSQDISRTPENASVNFSQNEIVAQFENTKTETGEFEEIPASSPAPPIEQSEPNATYSHEYPIESSNQAVNNFVSTENGDNYNTYDNTAQQQTIDSDILNNNTGQSTDIQDSYENNFETNSMSESQETTPIGDTVWLSETGTHYHNKNDCGRMNPNKARQVSLDYAINAGYDKCEKCFPY